MAALRRRGAPSSCARRPRLLGRRPRALLVLAALLVARAAGAAPAGAKRPPGSAPLGAAALEPAPAWRNRSAAIVEGRGARRRLASGAWSSIADMGTVRERHGMGAVGGKLYVAGGRRDAYAFTVLSSAEVYDPSVNAW